MAKNAQKAVQTGAQLVVMLLSTWDLSQSEAVNFWAKNNAMVQVSR